MRRAEALVIGLGAIGARHARVLGGLGCAVATVSRRSVGDFTDLAEAVSTTAARYAVIANETAAHAGTLAALARAEFRGRVLVEKPLFAMRRSIPENDFASAHVGYNLRFHPALQRVRELLAGETPLEAAAYVGRHLPDWRPGRDYRATASASPAAGGGVLRDLSHELDYLLWLFGPWRRVTALVQHTGALGIETEDVAAILMECTRCPAVTVHLNYHHRPLRRLLTVNTSRHTIEADLTLARVRRDGEDDHRPAEQDETYRAMHRAALSDGTGLCGLEEGLAVVDLIAAIERAGEERRWIEQ